MQYIYKWSISLVYKNRPVFCFWKYSSDENTISAAERTIENLISTLEAEAQAAIEWFKLNEMIINPEKFQAIVVKKTA